MRDGVAVQVYPNARRPDWPEAEFIVGNPPFIGGKDLRSRMMPGYAEALWKAHKAMNESADFVMYWWDRSAELLTRKKTPLRRFGFVTTNSISRVFQRRVIERHLNAKTPISLAYAISDHPWTKATPDSAAVRIAMTAAVSGINNGNLQQITEETDLDSDEPKFEFETTIGRINSDLTVGIDLNSAKKLSSNLGISSRGVVLHGAGFIATEAQARHLGLGQRQGLDTHIRPYRNGRDIMGRSRNVMAIDLFGLTPDVIRRDFPEVYQHVLEHIKPERDMNPRAYRRDGWWLFGENVPDARTAWNGVSRYMATVETAKHRVFVFLDRAILPDNKLVCIALEDAAWLSVASSTIHRTWYHANSGMIGVFDQDAVYVKSRCFDPFPFPFPDPSDALRATLRDLGEELDATRKTVQAEHPDLTLTGLYNVLEKIRAGTALEVKDEDVKARGRVLILKDLHDQIDHATADAYGWPHDLSDEQVLERLVALNAQRAAEEAAGHVRWLRPGYQIPRFARTTARTSGALDLGDNVVAFDRSLPVFPKDKSEQPLAIRSVLERSGRAMDATEIARAFKAGGKRIEPRVIQALYTLVRYGWITPLSDGRFAARRAA